MKILRVTQKYKSNLKLNTNKETPSNEGKYKL